MQTSALSSKASDVRTSASLQLLLFQNANVETTMPGKAEWTGERHTCDWLRADSSAPSCDTTGHTGVSTALVS